MIRPFLSFKCFMFFMFATSLSNVHAQYVINGTGQQLSCNCYRLTEAQNDQAGSVWNENMISLEDPFDFTFDVYLGDQPQGADGIAFVLQPISTAAGTTGGGMGYAGIIPSVAVEVDTYKNDWDPTFDHLAVQVNGDVNHTTANNLAGPELALVSGGDLEDGEWHLMRVTWDPITQTLDTYMDGSLRISYQGDIVADHLNDDPQVFWGFTGSTGGFNNRQEFCLAIIPGLESNTNEICAGDSVVFDDDSYSALGSVVEWSWDFGNGQTTDAQTPGAVAFQNAGTYTVVQTILDAAGCDASDSLQVVVNPNPQADFQATAVCDGEETDLLDQSELEDGDIVSWDWTLEDGETATGSTVTTTFIEAGLYDVSLLVTSSEGCTDSVTQEVEVYSDPEADFQFETNGFDASFTTAIEAGEQAVWSLPGLDTVLEGTSPVQFTFPDSGYYDVQLLVVNENGCADSVTYEVYIEGIPEYRVPNVFTPDGDGINDRFQPETYAMVEAELKVFSRWGRSLYTYSGPVQDDLLWGWDGTASGGPPAADGTYYYVLSLRGTDGNLYGEQGTVTLLKAK